MNYTYGASSMDSVFRVARYLDAIQRLSTVYDAGELLPPGKLPTSQEDLLNRQPTAQESEPRPMKIGDVVELSKVPAGSFVSTLAGGEGAVSDPVIGRQYPLSWLPGAPELSAARGHRLVGYVLRDEFSLVTILGLLPRDEEKPEAPQILAANESIAQALGAEFNEHVGNGTTGGCFAARPSAERARLSAEWSDSVSACLVNNARMRELAANGANSFYYANPDIDLED